MRWRARYAWRRLRHRLRFPLSFRIHLVRRRGLIWTCFVGGLAAGLLWAVATRDLPQGAVTTTARGAVASVAGFSGPAWRGKVGGLPLGLDVEKGALLFQQVLPGFRQGSSGIEPVQSWRSSLRSLMHWVTGYDWSNPMTFLEAEVAGLKTAVAQGMERERIQPSGNQRPRAQQADETNRGDDANQPALSHRTDVELVEQSHSDRGAPVERPGPLERVPSRIEQRGWDDDPLVLVVHTHTSESYRTVPADPRADSSHHVFNEEDTGITRVGAALAKALEERHRIRVVHSRRIHNWPDHWAAYVNARNTVSELLDRYPSIQVVLDLHREGIPGITYQTTIGGVDAVQVDILYTTGQSMSYGAHPQWRENETFAHQLAQAIEDIHPGMLRRLERIDDRRYNQDLHPRMVLLEVGNYLDLEEHAIETGRLLADPIAAVVRELVAPSGASPRN